MPAPYALIPMPPGDFKNVFDYQAIHMAAAHNGYIQGLNAAVAHSAHVSGDKIKPFMFFCKILVENIHHHHELEEEYIFPAYEKNLGEGAMSGNQNEHETFIHQLEDFGKWIDAVHDGTEQYDAAVFLAKLNSFGDTMIDHMGHEIATLDTKRMQENFTEKELRDIDAGVMKIIMKKIDFHTALPIAMVCMNPAFPEFPPFPTPLKWAGRWWFSRKHAAAWEFGATDFYGKPRELPPFPTTN